MNDKIKINLQMADESFTMTINRDEEELYRKAAKQVNDRMNVYRSKYKPSGVPGAKVYGQKDFLAMVAFDFACNNLKLEEKNDTSPFTNKIEELTQDLEEHFSKE
ncbi:cell division protein ZapA [uncultured Bacteroides sp.]|jgi:Cell division protein ZapA.|uniref:cell division protein ZapA n=1 Tax=uncultured Bacteroides sp. TaxID=162156 RepID=UPI002AAA983A|nr:cell division protein ZapA [uncultured Bacteroides sp.]